MLRFFSAALYLLCVSSACASTSVPQYQVRKDIVTGFGTMAGLVAADFNGDGKPDLAATDSSTRTVIVYLNDGKGGFGAGISTAVNIGSTVGLGAIVAGDINEDGKQDLVVASIAGSQPTYALIGNGDGTFIQSAQAATWFTDARLVDINGDGHLDLVGIYSTATAPTIGIGDGKGNFAISNLTLPAAASSSGYSSYGLASGMIVADLTGDNHPDVLTSLSYSQSDYLNALDFYANKADGSFSAPAIKTNIVTRNVGSIQLTSSDLIAYDLAAADFNGDGKLDLLAGQYSDALIYLGNGDGSFGITGSTVQALTNTAVSTVTVFSRVAAGDVNGDGYPDAVYTSPDHVYLTLNDGKGNFSRAVPDFSALLDGASRFLRIADLNGDGIPDLIVGSATTKNIEVFLSISQPMATLTGSSAFPATAVGTSSAPQVFSFANTSDSAISVNSLVTSSAEYQPTNTCGLTLAARASCTISIIFRPANAGARPGSLTIASTAIGGTNVLALTGTGVAAAGAVTGTAAFPATLVGNPSTAQSFLLTNTSTVSLAINSIVVTGDFAQTNTCGSSVAVSSSCSIGVIFQPTALGTRSGLLNVSTNASTAIAAVSLTGVGAAAPTFALGDNGSGATNTALTVTAGSNASGTLKFTSVNGFAGSIALACAAQGTAPAGAGCTTTSLVILGAGATATGIVTMTTTARTQTAGLGNMPRRGRLLYTALVLSLAGLLFSARRNASALRGAGLCAVCFLFAGALTGCSSGASKASVTPTADPNGTPAGTYAYNITASSGGLSQTQTVTLTVQ